MVASGVGGGKGKAFFVKRNPIVKVVAKHTDCFALRVGKIRFVIANVCVKYIQVCVAYLGVGVVGILKRGSVEKIVGIYYIAPIVFFKGGCRVPIPVKAHKGDVRVVFVI